MTRSLIAAAILTVAALPASALANCPAVPQGSAMVSCEQGVRVVRNTASPIRVITPAQSAQMKIQREQIALQRAQLRQQARANNRQFELERERVRQQGYLIRDANSPLRQRSQPRGFGTRGFRNNGVVVVPR